MHSFVANLNFCQKVFPLETKDGAIEIWNRTEKRLETEQVYGEALVQWVYKNTLGQFAANAFLAKPGVSRLVGFLQSTSFSRKQIKPFIEKFRIPMQEFEETNYQSFNEFFIRKFKKEARPFTMDQNEMSAPAEGRYFAYERVMPHQTLPVKGHALQARSLLADEEMAKPFQDGPVLLVRLCPTDYHRFHFPDTGRVLLSKRITGNLHSVNPVALRYKDDIFITNERQVTLLQTENFGQIAYIEVGALCVGKIVQSHPSVSEPSRNGIFKRGDEKGYFLFGGSTVIILGQKGMWIPDSDLIEQTQKNRESLVFLGQRVATRL